MASLPYIMRLELGMKGYPVKCVEKPKPHIQWHKVFAAKVVSHLKGYLTGCLGEYYKSKLGLCGEDVVFYPGVSIIYPETVRIGSHTHLGEQCHLRGGGQIKIGDWCQIANNVIIATAGHRLDGKPYYGNVFYKDITIGNNVWIGSGAIILPGVIIGDNSVIAAGAVVSESVEANMVVGGIPAKVIRSLKK